MPSKHFAEEYAEHVLEASEPSLKEFLNFPQYVKTLYDANPDQGIYIIRPPKDKNGESLVPDYDYNSLKNVIISEPSVQIGELTIIVNNCLNHS